MCPIYALPLARLDHQDMALDPFPAVVHMTDREAQELRHDFKRRLQAYCGGLLEICEATLTRVSSHRGPRMWSVQFMHRTVFEFLSIPGVLEMECMRTRSNAFNPHCLLAWVLSDFMLNHNYDLGSMKKQAHDEVVKGCLVYAKLADHNGWQIVNEMLQHLGDLSVFESARLEHDIGQQGPHPSMDIILAVEAGIA